MRTLSTVNVLILTTYVLFKHMMFIVKFLPIYMYLLGFCDVFKVGMTFDSVTLHISQTIY
jgi:hypothetical protein